jgi:TDG/mug DNA glycosylase family protein
MTSADPFHHAFDRVADAQTRLLVLGSLPGRQSLAAARYYAHPQNQFWRLMSPAAGVNLAALDYAERLRALLAAGIGLWDVVGSARRRGSLDTAIRDAAPRDLKAAIAELPSLRAMAFNGAAAFAIGQRQLGAEPGVALIPLPSSSAAHAIGVEAKRAAWDRLGDWLT